jgi:hypothetical protein
VGAATVKSPVRLQIILTAAVTLLLSGAVIVVGAGNLASQNVAPSEVPDPSPSHSVGEYSWSDALQKLYDEQQTLTIEAYGLETEPGWMIHKNGILSSNGSCSTGGMEVVGTEGEIQIRRLNCFDLDGKLIGFYEERYKWVVRQPTHELAIELPPDWPWTPTQIDAGRQLMLEDAASLNMPICPGLFVAPMPMGRAGDPPCLSYPMYLSEEFVTTGKVLSYGAETSARWERQPCVAEICADNGQAWHTVDTSTVVAWKKYWERYTAYCAAIADFNKRLKVLAETDPELTWDPTTYDRMAFDYNYNFLWLCQLPQLPPTDADWLRRQVSP